MSFGDSKGWWFGKPASPGDQPASGAVGEMEAELYFGRQVVRWFRSECMWIGTHVA